jgi:hypothetical protein
MRNAVPASYLVTPAPVNELMASSSPVAKTVDTQRSGVPTGPASNESASLLFVHASRNSFCLRRFEAVGGYVAFLRD